MTDKLEQYAQSSRSRRTPLLANIRPIGQYQMEDFFYAGSVLTLLNELQDHLHAERLTINGQTLAENIAGAKRKETEVILPLSNPLHQEGGLSILCWTYW